MENRSLLISVGLHAGIVVLAWIGLPSLKRDLPDEQPIVAMEIVQTVPTTNLIQGDKSSTAKQEQKPARKKNPPPPKPPAPKPPAPKPAPKKIEKQVDPKAEILPDKVTPKPKPAEATSMATPTKLPKSPPKRTNKMAQKKARQKAKADALSGVMQNLAKVKTVAQDAEKKRREKERKKVSEKLVNSLSAASGNAIRAPKPKTAAPMGLSDIDRIRQHVSSCWSPPIGTAGADTLNVDIIVTLDRDGKVLTAEVDNKLRLGIDRTYRVAADEAIRTMFKCSPLPVPLDKYEQWKSFVFGFDPKFLTR